MNSQQEKNKLAESFFYNLFFKHYHKNTDKSDTTIELYINGDCNLRCPYCYITRFGDKLYPECIRDRDNIKNNMVIFFNWMHENDYFINTLALFSGELFAEPFGLEVMEIIYEACKKKPLCSIISVPTNFSFISDDNYTKHIEEFITKFRDIEVDLWLSCSIDGAPVDKEARARNKTTPEFRDADYYDKLFKFLKKYHYGIHPMVGRIFLENYKENYDWWIDNIIKYDIRSESGGMYTIPMFLEIRNDDWPDDILELYSQFLQYSVEVDLEKLHKGNIIELTHRLFRTHKTKFQQSNEICKMFATHNKISCAVQAGPYVRLGDLSLVPCHRTSYSQFEYGRFIVENNKIVGIEGKNVSLAMKIYSMNPNVSHPLCSDCLIKATCIKGCLGSQFETNKELFMPIDGVCNLLYTKHKTLHHIFTKYDMYNIICNDADIDEDYKNHVRKVEKIICQL